MIYCIFSFCTERINIVGGSTIMCEAIKRARQSHGNEPIEIKAPLMLCFSVWQVCPNTHRHIKPFIHILNNNNNSSSYLKVQLKKGNKLCKMRKRWHLFIHRPMYETWLLSPNSAEMCSGLDETFYFESLTRTFCVVFTVPWHRVHILKSTAEKMWHSGWRGKSCGNIC